LCSHANILLFHQLENRIYMIEKEFLEERMKENEALSAIPFILSLL
jgi:hypothetical protein